MVTLNIYKDNVKDNKGNLYPIYNINIVPVLDSGCS